MQALGLSFYVNRV